jgi:hypothetical protein
MITTYFRRSRGRFLLFLPLIVILLVFPILSSSSAAQTVNAAGTPSALEQQVKTWVDELSVHKPFSLWKSALIEVQPLGPGTHGWLAVLKAPGGPVGYLVVYAAADGTYRLGEYGTGTDPLFSPDTLAATLVENGLIPSKNSPYKAQTIYFHPFAAVWEVTVGTETYWVDGKTGEILPFERKGWNLLLPALRANVQPLTASSDHSGTLLLTEPFDAYERLPWVSGEAPADLKNSKEVQGLLRGGLHLRYVTEPYGDAALYALPVVGFHSWSNGRLDLALDMEGTRFIPLDHLQQNGLFYE